MTDRLSHVFTTCREEGRAALIGYLPTGYPDVETSIAAMTALVESGCDIIEVGIAYSDPGMDGRTIAAATHAALHGGCLLYTSLHRGDSGAPREAPDEYRRGIGDS